MKDINYMKMAIELAGKGCGFVNPNPMVGALIVKNDEVIGSGYHEHFGGPHAERNAFASCSKSPLGATLYVTLEPCCHHGKTPPCTDIILKNKIARVVIGTMDPNPLVGGKGVEILRENGIQVDVGLLELECNEQNEVFFHQIKNQKPFVALKYAMTLDGKIATRTGESQWITGDIAREHVHLLRHRYSAILAGIGTVLADDPMLNCRQAGGKNPARVICDTNLRIPLDSRIVQSAGEILTYIGHSSYDEEKIKKLEMAGCKMIFTDKDNSHVNLGILMDRLFEYGLDSVLCEGGSAIHYSMISGGHINKLYAYIGPKLVGGQTSKSPIGGLGIEKLSEAVLLNNRKIRVLGDDVLLEYGIVHRKSQEA